MRSAYSWAVAAASIAATALTAAPAESAARSFERCPAGHFCLFDGYDGSGLMASFRQGSPNLAGQSMDNRASSLAHNVPDTVWCVYEGRNYTGDYFRVYPGAAGPLSELDNAISSVRRGECSP
ncbi:peptidase inhibitor family I36 protein [Streptomyces griseus]|uniref:peptidase inhibitor family I36 protein n=1 Tax=Streptomyces griseus TaxID=1911 RepID=UPI0037A79D10